MAKRGRKAKCWVDSETGRPVDGLRRDVKSGRFYPVGKGSPSFGNDETLAIARFRRWKADQEGEPGTIPFYHPSIPDDVAAQLEEWHAAGLIESDDPDAGASPARTPEELLADGELKDDPAPGPIPARIVLDERSFWRRVRYELLTDPAKVALKTEIPQLAYFNEWKPPEPSLKLPDIGVLYRDKRKTISNEWKRKTRLFWHEFCDTVKVKTVRDLTPDHIDAYYNKAYDEYAQHGRSPTYVAHRFQCIKSIFRHAMTKGRDQEQLRRVLDLCAMLIPPDKAGHNPRPISREHFAALLSVSDNKWRAIFLLSLNAALYPSEVAVVERSHIDLDAATLVMDRPKTGVPRIAVLWERTVNAIRAYQAEYRHDSAYVFVSATGLPYNANHMSRNFRRRRAAAGLPDTVKFDNIRDGAYTAGYRGRKDLDAAKMLAGHRVGTPDFYLKRDPSLVADACEAIEHAYFG